MKKNKKKEYSIQNFEELMALVNEDNIDMIFGNFYGVAKHFLELKKEYKGLVFTGFKWIDDGKVQVTGSQINFTLNCEFPKK